MIGASLLQKLTAVHMSLINSVEYRVLAIGVNHVHVDALLYEELNYL